MMNQEVFNEAKIHFENCNYFQAEKKFRALLEDDKNNLELAYYLGSTLIKRDQYDEAVKLLEKACKSDEADYRLYEALGEAYGMKAQNISPIKAALVMPKIKKTFKKALDLNPQALGAREGLFMFYLFAPGMAGGDEDKAAELMQEIKNINEARGFITEGIYQRKQDEIEPAIAAFTTAQEKGEDDPEVQMKAGRFFLNNDLFEKAMLCFNLYLQLKPLDAQGYAAMGELRMKQENFENALSFFNKALEINEHFFPAKFNRARALQQLNRNMEAVSDLKEIIRNYPDSPQAEEAKRVLVDIQ